MAVHSTSYQFSASYGAASVWKKGTPASSSTREAIENASSIPLELQQQPYEDSWQKLWGAEERGMENEDGTVSRTVSGGVNLIGGDRSGNTCRGRADFRVSLTFDPAAYEDGQLSSTVDLMTAAYTVSKKALHDCAQGASDTRPGVLNETDPARLEEDYQAKKDTVAKSFADLAGTPLEERGCAGEWDKVYKSVHAVFASFEAKYQAVTAGGGDRFMDADLWTAAIKLQKIGASFQITPGRAQGLYSLRELEYTAAGVRAGLNRRV